ncbi:MAG: hypothetical protein JO279_09030 [Verrucomicrobia bacterium]|nr:hypothetical protein [Verrucomicrobiota bacterium]
MIASFRIFVFLGALALITSTLKASDVHIRSLPYLIKQPGTYVLDLNLSYNSETVDAIQITASNVRLDFQNHSISYLGTNANTVSACVESFGNSNVKIVHGSIVGFMLGVYAGKGANILVDDMNFHYQTMCGVYIGQDPEGSESPNSSVRGCVVTHTGYAPNGEVVSLTGDAVGLYGEWTATSNSVSSFPGIAVWPMRAADNNVIKNCEVGVQGEPTVIAEGNTIKATEFPYAGGVTVVRGGTVAATH